MRCQDFTCLIAVKRVAIVPSDCECPDECTDPTETVHARASRRADYIEPNDYAKSRLWNFQDQYFQHGHLSMLQWKFDYV